MIREGLAALAGFFGRVAVPVSPALPTPVVLPNDTDPDLQELTPEELAEIELAESLWPQKELAAHLQARYGDGERPPGLDPHMAARVAEAQAKAVRPLPPLSRAEQHEEMRRIQKLPESPKLRQAHETPHAARVAEIIQKAHEMRNS